ncbi:hypothetical protein [Rhodococcus qingshengii]|uniref:hypothetical protein n=1 Tax=Rhodococcus qingshengii TaxID=334542 RepID=UPI00211E1B3F|nr:hypothetical protein [Rhodococcus qingshengii]
MNPLMVTGRVGKLMDHLAGDLDPLARAQRFTDRPQEIGLVLEHPCHLILHVPEHC